MREHAFSLIASVLVLVFLSVVLARRVSSNYISNKIEELGKKEETIASLIKDTQKGYFVERVMGERLYKKTIERHMKRMARIQQAQLNLRLKSKQPKESSGQESKKKEADMIKEMMKELQLKYFRDKLISPDMYESMTIEFKRRHAKLEEEIEALENKGAIKKEAKSAKDAKPEHSEELASPLAGIGSPVKISTAKDDNSSGKSGESMIYKLINRVKWPKGKTTTKKRYEIKNPKSEKHEALLLESKPNQPVPYKASLQQIPKTRLLSIEEIVGEINRIKEAISPLPAARPQLEKEALPKNYFWLHKGGALKSLNELKEALKKMDNETFAHHVNNKKNDFSSWIKHSFGDASLADKISNLSTKEEMASLLEGISRPQAGKA